MRKAARIKKRHLLGVGYIWFSRRSGVAGARGFDHVALTTYRDGVGPFVAIKIGALGGWQKVRLYAEYILPKKSVK